MSAEARKLPLWRAWLEANEARLTYGAAFKTEDLEAFFGVQSDRLAFRVEVIAIRAELLKRGMNFTERGQNGAGFVIAQPNTNADEVERMQRAAISAMGRSVVLATTTPMQLLTEQERRKHEAVAEKAATRLALLSRTAPQLSSPVA